MSPHSCATLSLVFYYIYAQPCPCSVVFIFYHQTHRYNPENTLKPPPPLTQTLTPYVIEHKNSENRHSMEHAADPVQQSLATFLLILCSTTRNLFLSTHPCSLALFKSYLKTCLFQHLYQNQSLKPFWPAGDAG